jgi:hypothetical protein
VDGLAAVNGDGVARAVRAVRAVVFDIGGVIERTDGWEILGARWDARMGFRPGEFAERLRASGLGMDAALGRISEERFHQALAELYGMDARVLEEFIAKPDPAIYQLTCERLGVRPDETVFVDDSGKRKGQGSTRRSAPCSRNGPIGQQQAAAGAPGGRSARLARVGAVPGVERGAVPAPAGLALETWEVLAPVGPQQRQPRLGPGRRPREQPAQRRRAELR